MFPRASAASRMLISAADARGVDGSQAERSIWRAPKNPRARIRACAASGVAGVWEWIKRATSD